MNPTIAAELRLARRPVSRRRAALFAIVLAAVGFGCAPKPGGATPARPGSLPFIENDFAQAVERASSANLPLFVEVWAPW